MKPRKQYRNPSLKYYQSSPRARHLQLLNTARFRARKRGLEFNLDLEWFEEKIASGYCEKTGLAFCYAKPAGRRIAPYSPSLDREDNSIGYTKANTRVVISAFNLAKNEFTEEEFLQIMKAYVARNDNKCV
jgi:hypothetical protein